MSHKEHFEIPRNSDASHNYDVIKCKLRGIKKKVVIEHEETQDELDNGIRWIFVEGAKYNLEAHEILEWLGKYGTFETNLTEK